MTYAAPTPTIGLTLPVPSSGQKFETTNVNGNFTLIDSAFNADRNRLGSLETWRTAATPQLARTTLTYFPTGPLNTPTAIPQVVWFTIGNVNVPAGAVTAHVHVDIMSMVTPTLATNILLQLGLGTGSGSNPFRIPGSGTNSTNYNFSFADIVPLPVAGTTQALVCKATFQAGTTGVYQVNNSSVITASVEFA